MSRTKLGLAFLASLAIGGAAASLTATPVYAAAPPPCSCSECDYSQYPWTCRYQPGRSCYLWWNIDIGYQCMSSACSPTQSCIGGP